ncbi:Cystatin/monellin superfamily protein [Hirschfeldia incana]|nr:Cystatin/monellin superfamily protein [Hirschfeldia incana]
MNPSASMVETVDGELEVTQHVDASMSDCIKLPTKRKAETSLVADPVEGEGSREEEQEEEKDSGESDQVWDVDSFESDYESPEEPASDTDEFEMRRYMRHLYESRGFLLKREMVPKKLFQGWRPLNLDAIFRKPNITGRDYMETMAQVAIDKFNQTKNKTVTLDHIARAVIRMSIGVKAYITFMAKESPRGELVEYQAKAEIRVWQTKIHPILCRPTPSSS